MKDTNFFDKESLYYSVKRYQDKPLSYNQYFFGRRLAIVLNLIRRTLPKKSLLEIGCADGIVIKKILQAFPSKFESIIGIDISSGMIEVAKREVAGGIFMERKDYKSEWPKDLVLEIGVLNYTDFATEMQFVYDELAKGGSYILSVAGNNSVWKRLISVDLGYQNLLSYREYERLIREKFEIVEAQPVGLFMPKIWKFPGLARFVQPVLETIFSISPDMYHEKIYLVRKR